MKRILEIDLTPAEEDKLWELLGTSDAGPEGYGWSSDVAESVMNKFTKSFEDSDALRSKASM